MTSKKITADQTTTIDTKRNKQITMRGWWYETAVGNTVDMPVFSVTGT